MIYETKWETKETENYENYTIKEIDTLIKIIEKRAKKGKNTIVQINDEDGMEIITTAVNSVAQDCYIIIFEYRLKTGHLRSEIPIRRKYSFVALI